MEEQQSLASNVSPVTTTTNNNKKLLTAWVEGNKAYGVGRRKQELSHSPFWIPSLSDSLGVTSLDLSASPQMILKCLSLGKDIPSNVLRRCVE